MPAFQIRRRSDNHVLGWGEADPDSPAEVAVKGLGLVVSRDALLALDDDRDHDLVWLDVDGNPVADDDDA